MVEIVVLETEICVEQSEYGTGRWRLPVHPDA